MTQTKKDAIKKWLGIGILACGWILMALQYLQAHVDSLAGMLGIVGVQ